MNKLLIIPIIIICIGYPTIIYGDENVNSKLKMFETQLSLQIDEIQNIANRYKEILKTYITKNKTKKAIGCIKMHDSLSFANSQLTTIKHLTHIMKYIKEEHKFNYYNYLINEITHGISFFNLPEIGSVHYSNKYKNDRQLQTILNDTTLIINSTNIILSNIFNFLIKYRFKLRK
jgi:hypothetical protein